MRAMQEKLPQRKPKDSEVRIFSMGSVTAYTYHNPIIYEGSPRITFGITSAARICYMMVIAYLATPPAKIYHQGWEHELSQPKPIKCTWKLHTFDKDSEPVDINFDLTDINSPLTLGIDFLQYSDTNNLRDPRLI